MINEINKDFHYAGVFVVDDVQVTGNLIYNKGNGVIALDLVRKLSDVSLPKLSYGKINIITGELNSGTKVTLFNNRCVGNNIKAFQTQEIVFIAEYIVWANNDASNKKFNKFVCSVENALEWSGLSTIEVEELASVKFNRNQIKSVYNWFGTEISFSTSLYCELFNFPRNEESKVIERLVITIETKEKKEISFFKEIRNKVVSLISFAIKDNVNYEEQCLYDLDDKYQNGDFMEYNKYYLYTSDKRLSTSNNKRHIYNFKLKQLLPEKDIQNELVLLEPILNLYLSLFKYSNMPPEMVFLNIVQALETFHSRFFYDNKKDKYVESVTKRFGNRVDFSFFKKLLLCDTQMDKNCNYIILVSRLNDLLVGEFDGLFHNYYVNNSNFAQQIADTRHYYTHYEKTKEEKALKGDELIQAINVLSLLLEYHVCLKLGINNRENIISQLALISLSESELNKIKQEKKDN